MDMYLVLYRSTTTAGEQMAAGTPEERQASTNAWMAWSASAGDALLDWGSPTQPVTDDDTGPAGWVGGYSILAAQEAAEVQTILSTHPQLTIGTIGVVQLLPMPGA